MKTALVLFNLGGPDSLEAVKPVLVQHLAKQFGLDIHVEATLPAQLAAV